MENKNTTKLFGLFSQVAIPDGATAVQNFKIEKYLGRWYEIARMDFFWEKKQLTNVYAEYRLNDEETVDVKNTGYNEKKEKWESYEGEARFRGDSHVAGLEVSFFMGIWAGYNVISVDEDYKYALVYGRNLDYCWMLSRERTMPQHIKDKYLKMLNDTGFDVSKIHYVDQRRSVEPYVI